MKKIFLSADIEGTCGIAHWDETLPDKRDYARFQQQMTREVRAACEGFTCAGVEQLFIRDAHDTARNLLPEQLPENIALFRGWGRDPWAMMSGIDATFDGVAFTGYHSAASWDGSPLSHTMNLKNTYVRINDELASELMINSLTASAFGVPVLLVTGDQMLCDSMSEACPGTLTVPVMYGVGSGTVSIHPDKAVRLIREAAEKAVQLDPALCLFPLPEYFTVEVGYRFHGDARSASFYPGARLEGSTSVVFESNEWEDCLRFFHFCL